MKSANLRVENVQRCYMLFLFSFYYHVVCTACDPVSGFFKLRFGISGCTDGGF